MIHENSTIPLASFLGTNIDDGRVIYQVNQEAGSLLLKDYTNDDLSWAFLSDCKNLPLPKVDNSQEQENLKNKFSLITKESEDRGRYTVLHTENGESFVQKGTLLLESSALAAIITEKSFEKACHLCLQPPSQKILMCGGCEVAHYCSRKCYDMDEEGHALICARLRKMRKWSKRRRRTFIKRKESFHSFDLDMIYLALKTLVICLGNFRQELAEEEKKVDDRALEKGIFPATMSSSAFETLKAVESLESHCHDRGGKKESIMRELWEEALEISRSLLEKIESEEQQEEEEEEEEEGGGTTTDSRQNVFFQIWKEEEVAELLLRIRFNAHPFVIYPQEQSSTTTLSILALFPDVASTLNHACCPTAAISFDYRNTRIREGQGSPQLVVQVRNIQDLSQGDEITYSYLSQLHQPLQDRQRALKLSFLFDCHCLRCTKEGEEDQQPVSGGMYTSYESILEQSKGLLQRARKLLEKSILSTTSTSRLPSPPEEQRDRRKLLQECQDWFAYSKNARYLPSHYEVRTEMAMILLQLAQEYSREDAVATATGVLDLFFVNKNLVNHPQRASLLVARAQALSKLLLLSTTTTTTTTTAAIPAAPHNKNGHTCEYFLTQQARLQSITLAAYIYEIALGSEHRLTQQAHKLMSEYSQK